MPRIRSIVAGGTPTFRDAAHEAEVRARFESKLSKPEGEDGCWIWTGSLRFYIGNFVYQPRRLWWFLLHREMPPDGIRVRCTCDVERCCNPTHLFLGTNEARFWRYVEKTDGCWWWRGTLCGKGTYGQFSVTKDGRDFDVPAHRFSYELAHGPIEGHVGHDPENEICVCHRCDNPQCVRPDHLFLGRDVDNIADKVAKGRQAKGPALAAAIRRAREAKKARQEQRT